MEGTIQRYRPTDTFTEAEMMEDPQGEYVKVADVVQMLESSQQRLDDATRDYKALDELYKAALAK